MSENESTKEKKANNTAPLSENDLSDVSGGLWGITLIDTCIQEFSFNKCCHNFGKCPNLIVKKPSSHIDNSTGTKMYDYTFSCAKGYFYNEIASMNRELPSY